MLSGFDKEAMRQQVSYYNNDDGCDLGDDSPIRAVYANIAWCLVDAERFMEYYQKSNFWAVQLHSAIRQFARKPSLLPKQVLGDREYKKLRKLVYDYLNENLGRKFILRPHELDLTFDEHSVYIMLVQIYDKEHIYASN